LSSSQSERALRVGIDLRLAGYREGGIARYATELSHALGDVPGIDVRELRSVRDDTQDRRSLRLRTPPHHRIEERAIGIELMLKRVALDVYHATDFVVPRLRGVACVATVHDLSFVHWPADHTAESLRYYRRLTRSARRTDAWITPSAWTADDLASVYGIDRESIHVIPHGVSLGLLDAPPLPRSKRRDFVLAVGTVEPRKRYDLLLDAIRRPDLPELIVVGHPGWRTDETQARLRANPRIVWIRGADDNALRLLLREALALVMPSRAEGFGLPALEAMACGTPVLCSRGGAIPEVVGDAGVYVGDAPEEWAETIGRIALDRSAWQVLSHAARARAAGFSWSRAAEQTAAVYRAVTA
jgi:glycosyltransferase involved in cell wall biosynthesis